MPHAGHVGRRYRAAGEVIDPQRAERFATAIAGSDASAEPGMVPPTFAAVYCLFPTLAQLFADEEVGINLAGLVHGEQEFRFPSPVHPGDRVDATAEIASVEVKRGMTFVGIDVAATREGDGATVCEGRALLIIRG